MSLDLERLKKKISLASTLSGILAGLLSFVLLLIIPIEIKGKGRWIFSYGVLYVILPIVLGILWGRLTYRIKKDKFKCPECGSEWQTHIVSSQTVGSHTETWSSMLSDDTTHYMMKEVECSNCGTTFELHYSSKILDSLEFEGED